MFFLENLRIVFNCDSTGPRSFAPILTFFPRSGYQPPHDIIAVYSGPAVCAGRCRLFILDINRVNCRNLGTWETWRPAT
jgi:hypothetical protein